VELLEVGADLARSRGGQVGESPGLGEGQAVIGGDHPEQQQPGQQSQTADGGHDQRLQGVPAALRVVAIEADEEKRADARQLPEHVERQDVVGQHDA